MCHQAVGLIQAELERRGIRTASITLLPEVTREVRPPRALSVPLALGYPLGTPGDPPAQRRILRQLLRLVLEDGVPIVAELSSGDIDPGHEAA
jgi:hypothetical protein